MTTNDPKREFPDPGDRADDRDCPAFNPFGSPPISPLARSGSRAFPGHGHSGDSFGVRYPVIGGTFYRRALRVITEFVVTDSGGDAQLGTESVTSGEIFAFSVMDRLMGSEKL